MARDDHIFRRKDGRWEGRYEKDPDPGGRRRYGRCCGRKRREVRRKMERIRGRQKGGAPAAKQETGLTLSRFCDLWMALVRNLAGSADLARCQELIGRHIRPRLGDISVTELDVGQVEQFTKELLEEKHLPEGTVREVLEILQCVLRFAARSCPAVLPALEIIPSRDRHGGSRWALNGEEQMCFTRFLTEDINPLRLGILLALKTGLRAGEVCALRWKDIRPAEGTLQVGECPTVLPEGIPGGGPSVRTVPLPEDIRQLCVDLRPQDPEAFVLTGTRCSMELRTVRSSLKELAAGCGLEGVNFGTLRHTFALRGWEAGLEVEELSGILGYDSISVLLQQYVHATLDARRESMQRLSALLH